MYLLTNYNYKCVPIERVETKIKIRTIQSSSPEIKRTQFPLTVRDDCMRQGRLVCQAGPFPYCDLTGLAHHIYVFAYKL